MSEERQKYINLVEKPEKWEPSETTRARVAVHRAALEGLAIGLAGAALGAVADTYWLHILH